MIEPDRPLDAVARHLLGPGVATAASPIGDAAPDPPPPLAPEEAAQATRMAPRRLAEFTSGRAALRQALAALGEPPAALPRRADGPPAWPPGLTGSLSHGGGHVVAAVARLGPGLRALGIDLEPIADLPDELAREICRDDEDRSRALAVFGAKEAAYKAQFMLTGRILDFRAMRVTLSRGGRFAAVLTAPVGLLPEGFAMTGRQARAGALLVSAVRLA